MTTEVLDRASPGHSGPRVRPLSGNATWILKRIALGLLVLLAVSVVVFVASSALPSDPARAILGRGASAEQLATMRTELGLDRPVIVQYLSWLGGLLGGDLGNSYASRQPVISMVGPRLLNSLTLVALVIAIALPLALAFGMITALLRDRLLDRVVLIVSLCITALPEFIIGLGLVFFFSTTVFRIFPAVTITRSGSTSMPDALSLVLPVSTLALAVLPYLYRLTRASTIESLESEYVTMARLKGVLPGRIIRRHVLPNAVIPVIQGAAVMLAWLLGGIVVVEYVFRFPGLGSMLADAVGNRDTTLVQGIVLVFALGVVLINLLADVLTLYLTPRLRTAGRARKGVTR